MSAERNQVVLSFFEGQRGLERTAEDAVALVAERLHALSDELELAGKLGDDANPGARADRESAIREAALALGRACVDALNGLVVSGVVNMTVLRPTAVEADAPPLADAWTRAHNPFMALVEITTSQLQQIEPLHNQPNRLYRLLLHESLALAADIAAWSAWTQR